MSDPSLIDDLIGPNLAADGNRSALLAVYVRRVFSIEREQGYRALSERRDEILAKLGAPAVRVEFLLRGWLAADPAQWAEWADGVRLDPPFGSPLADLCGGVAAAMISSSTTIEDPVAIDAAASLVERLGPGLRALDPAELEPRLQEAAEAALADQWWHDEGALDRQVARHRLIAAVERAVPAAKGPLAEERARDATWPLGEVAPVDELVVRGWRQLSVELTDEAYEEIVEAIPRPDSAAQPALFAEALAAEAVIHRNGGFAGNKSVVREFLVRVKELYSLGAEYRDHRRVAISACIELAPTSNQLGWLLYYFGHDPDPETVAAVGRWSQGAGRGPTSTLIRAVMRTWVYSDWMPHFARLKYDEAPLLKKVNEIMLKDGSSIGLRLRYAQALRSLGLRTKGGPDKVAKLIVDLLTPTRANHRKNDLQTALVLCECLGPDHKKQTPIERALRAYSKKWGRDYTPDQYWSILMAGVTLPEEFLSNKTRRRVQNLVDEAAEVISRLNPF